MGRKAPDLSPAFASLLLSSLMIPSAPCELTNGSPPSCRPLVSIWKKEIKKRRIASQTVIQKTETPAR